MSKELQGKYLIHIKINNAEKAITYIPIIRKYNGASISEIKNRILTGYAISFDWYQRSNSIDDMNGINPHHEFRLLIDKLISSGAEITFYKQYNDNIEPIPLQIIDNMIQRDKEISTQTERDINSELGETWDDDYE